MLGFAAASSITIADDAAPPATVAVAVVTAWARVVLSGALRTAADVSGSKRLDAIISGGDRAEID